MSSQVSVIIENTHPEITKVNCYQKSKRGYENFYLQFMDW